MTPAGPTYACAACGLRWPYAAVRHTARCGDCGAGLLREDPPPLALVAAPQRAASAASRRRAAAPTTLERSA